MKLQSLSLLLTSLVSISTSQAIVLSGSPVGIVYNDAVDGFASSNGATPTAITFTPGTNRILGTVSSGGGTPAINNTRNFYTFSLALGQQLESISFDTLAVTTSAGAASTDPGFYALVLGSTAATPGNGFTNLGGALFSPSDIGSNLVDTISGGGISGGAGFSEIGPGDYTFVIQQTGDEINNFGLDFVVVPEPSTGLLILSSALLLGKRRRK